MAQGRFSGSAQLNESQRLPGALLGMDFFALLASSLGVLAVTAACSLQCACSVRLLDCAPLSDLHIMFCCQHVTAAFAICSLAEYAT